MLPAQQNRLLIKVYTKTVKTIDIIIQESGEILYNDLLCISISLLAVMSELFMKNFTQETETNIKRLLKINSLRSKYLLLDTFFQYSKNITEE